MLDNKQRNRKIIHIMESAIHDFCKVLGTSYYSVEGATMVQYEEQDLFYVYPEFHKREYHINIVCMVFQDLAISKTAKLKEIYNSEEIAEFVNEARASLWFLDDTRLVMSSIEKSSYSDFAILKSKLLLGIYAHVINARKLKDKLGLLLADSEQIRVN